MYTYITTENNFSLRICFVYMVILYNSLLQERFDFFFNFIYLVIENILPLHF